MENLYPENPPQEPAALVIDLPIRSYLTETIKWGKFLAILGFIFTGFIAIIGIIVIANGSSLNQISGFPSSMGFGLGVFYLLMALLYFFPSRFLYNFCDRIKMALFLNNQEALTLGFENLKSSFKFWGITAIVMIIFYILLMVGIIASTIFFAH